eukprot:GFKZ01004568.1.p1 GENE.GFKZ01004568.1~~GFKZ01004568.1.p1  ORF type:complete len:472 (-),score=46.43 GFKZ01004568.1:22-1389(-)
MLAEDEQRPRGLLSSMSTKLSTSVQHFCRFMVHEFLSRGISRGTLTLTHPDSTITLFGQSESESKALGHPTATIHLRNATSFYARVAATADIGFGEAYVMGDFTVANVDDLVCIFRVLILNRDERGLSTSGLVVSKIGMWLNGRLHSLNRNTLLGSRRNIEAHYDLSNELFGTFLGETWTYSCGYFGEGVKTLDEGQHRKIDMILDKARIRSGCHVLEIGCGWGELGIRAAQRFGCRVTGITLSKEQLVLARKRAEAAGVAEVVKFELADYREFAERGLVFDRVVSVEMMEALGHEFLGAYFEGIDKMLTAEGLVVLQVITTPEQRYEEYRGGVDFIQKYIFPGGICPSFEAVVGAVARHSGLVVEGVENIGVHYATTLREWRRRFAESVKRGDVAAAGFDEYFVRKWMYYLCYCEAGFATRTLATLQVVLSRINNTITLGGAPMVGGIGEEGEG